MRSLVVVALGALAVGCEGTEPPSASTESVVHLTRAPMAMTLEGPTEVKAGDEIAIALTVHGRPGVRVRPADIAWEVPAGVTILDGDEIKRPVTVGETRLVHVRIDSVPAEPFGAVASINGASFGLTSRAQYRFGQVAPKFIQPTLFRKR